jgi:hypothetical protein
MPQLSITGYEVQYASNNAVSQIGLLEGNLVVARLVFHPDGSALPADGAVNNQALLHYRSADFQNVYNLLNRAKNMSLIFNVPGQPNSIFVAPTPLGT